MDKSKKILVVYGGPSSEAEVSKNTSAAIFKALKNLGYNAELKEFSQELIKEIVHAKPDLVFNAMHGAYGEDGCLQGLLECLRIPYTHSGVTASAVGMNKFLAKEIFIRNGISCANSRIISREEVLAEKFNKPCVIKPIADGSSVGVIILKSSDAAFDKSQIGDQKEFLVEDFIEGRELTIGILDGKPLGSVEIRPKSGVYDYTSKYTKGMTEYLVPAQISDSLMQEAYEMAAKAHRLLGCKGVTRSDIMYDDKADKLYLLEINTHPGMTETSLVPKMAAASGISFESLVEQIISSAKFEILPNKK